MPTRPPLSPAQQRAWSARMQLHLPQEPDLKLAEKMALKPASPRDGGAYAKTVAGYLGELRRGAARGLTFFLDDEQRLKALSRVCPGCQPEDFRRDLRQVLEEGLSGDDRLLLSGFEDLGPRPLSEFFLLPPVVDREGTRLGVPALKKRLVPGGIVRVEGPGTTTLLRQLSAWAEEAGWRPVRWMGTPVAGRALAVLADDTDPPLPFALSTPGSSGGAALRAAVLAALGGTAEATRDWLKEGGHILLTAGAGDLSIRPVDRRWLDDLHTQVRALSIGRSARRPLPTVDVQAIADREVGPEEAGLLLREALEPSGESSLGRLSILARRRVRAADLPDRGLLGLESWLPGVAAALLLDPSADPAEQVDGGVLAQVQELVRKLPLGEEQRDLLKSALPWASGGDALQALRSAHLLGERQDRTEPRLLRWLAPALVERLEGDDALLAACFRDRRGPLLAALRARPGGPVRLAGGLERLGVAGLREAVRNPAAPWLRGLPIGERLVARLIAVAEADGSAEVSRKAGEKLRKIEEDAENMQIPLADGIRERLTARAHPPAWPLLEGRPPPAPDILAAEIVATFEALGALPPPTPPLHAWRAFHLADPADLRDPAVLSAWPIPRRWPPHWVAVAKKNAAVGTALWTHSAVRQQFRPLGLSLLSDLARLYPTAAAALVVARVDAEREELERALDRYLPPPSVAPPDEVLAGYTGGPSETRWGDTPPWRERVGAEGCLLPAHYLATMTKVLAGWEHAGKALEFLSRLDRLPKEPLRAAARRWSSVATDRGLPLGLRDDAPRPPGLFLPGLAELLCYLPANERLALLRDPSGRLGPLALEAIDAGVPAEAAVALAQGVDRGEIALPRRGDREVARKLLGEVCLRRFPEAAPRLGFWDPGRVAELAEAEFEALAGSVAGRRYLWSGHASGAEADVVWRLLSGKLYSPANLELRTVAFDKAGGLLGWLARFGGGRDASTLYEIDRSPLVALLPELSPLDDTRWEQVVRAALLAAVPPSALWPALDAGRLGRLAVTPVPPAKGRKPWTAHDTLRVLLEVLTAADPGRLRRWVVAAGPAACATLDRPGFRSLWRMLEASREELARVIDALPGDRVGEGPVGALLARDPSRVGPLLADSRTRQATLLAMGTDPSLRDHLVNDLAARQEAPEPGLVALLLKVADHAGLSLLEEVAPSWPLLEQRRLWQRVASSADGALRERAWGRLAELGG